MTQWVHAAAWQQIESGSNAGGSPRLKRLRHAHPDDRADGLRRPRACQAGQRTFQRCAWQRVLPGEPTRVTLVLGLPGARGRTIVLDRALLARHVACRPASPESQVHAVTGGSLHPMSVAGNQMPAVANPHQGRKPGGQHPGREVSGRQEHGRVLCRRLVAGARKAESNLVRTILSIGESPFLVNRYSEKNPFIPSYSVFRRG